MLVERLRGLSAAEAEARLEQDLVALAVLSKGLEAKADASKLSSEVGFRIAAVVRERVSQLLGGPSTD